MLFHYDDKKNFLESGRPVTNKFVFFDIFLRIKCEQSDGLLHGPSRILFLVSSLIWSQLPGGDGRKGSQRDARGQVGVYGILFTSEYYMGIIFGFHVVRS